MVTNITHGSRDQSGIANHDGGAFDSTPLTPDEYRFFFAARLYGADHRDAHGYAAVGSLADASTDMRGAFRTLTSTQGGGA